MSLPGFWATSSLYKTARPYHVRATPGSTPGLTAVEGSPRSQPGQSAALLSASRLPAASAVTCSEAECLYAIGLDYNVCIDLYLECARPLQPECYIAQQIKCKPILMAGQLRCRTDRTFQCEVRSGPGTCIDGICCDNVCGAECCGSGTTCIRSADADFCCPTQLACGDQCCSPGSSCCGLPVGECTDLTSDPFNCGSCGNICPSGTCCNGSCFAQGSRCCQGATSGYFYACPTAAACCGEGCCLSPAVCHGPPTYGCGPP
jgi:hypothetical protein